MMRSWGHQERLKALGGVGPGLAVVGVALGCWEGVGLWLGRMYAGSRGGPRER